MLPSERFNEVTLLFSIINVVDKDSSRSSPILFKEWSNKVTWLFLFINAMLLWWLVSVWWNDHFLEVFNCEKTTSLISKLNLLFWTGS